MKIITTTEEMLEYSRAERQKSKTIGFVPTMGFLHEGHLSLLRAARKDCDIVVLSVFVNPIQFGPGEDIEKYPRDPERDNRLAEKEGVDVYFSPSVDEMYPEGDVENVEVPEELSEKLCGLSRPGHFSGVATVVAKLFMIVEPDISYFGQKDAQQVAVIKHMVRDVKLPVDIRVMPVVREKDGLAMSSRNAYLSEDERRRAPGIYHSLKMAEKMIEAGESSAKRIKDEMERVLHGTSDISIEYIEVVDNDSLEPVEEVTSNTLIAVAARIGGTRLIDNITIKGNDLQKA